MKTASFRPLQKTFANFYSRAMVERLRVNSSKIRSVGYDERSRVLEVEHGDGSIFQYMNVFREIHRRLMSAPSLIGFYQDRIEEEFSRTRMR